jgi:hypothetical protein
MRRSRKGFQFFRRRPARLLDQDSAAPGLQQVKRRLAQCVDVCRHDGLIRRRQRRQRSADATRTALQSGSFFESYGRLFAAAYHHYGHIEGEEHLGVSLGHPPGANQPRHRQSHSTVACLWSCACGASSRCFPHSCLRPRLVFGLNYQLAELLNKSDHTTRIDAGYYFIPAGRKFR